MKSVHISLILALILAVAFVSALKADNHQSQSLTHCLGRMGPC